MDAEIITIGDEILTGHTVDTNSSFIAAKLTEIGYNVKYLSSAGDNVEQMEEAFRLALGRARVVITTGGLGPTDDDITKKAIVKVFKRNLIFHEDVLEDIKKRYATRGIEMPAINQNQALLPQGATFFPNRHGSAVGLCIVDAGRTFISLPGVPREMTQIMNDEIVPYLRGIYKGPANFIVKLRTTGIVESRIAEMIAAKIKFEPGARLAYLPDFSGVDLRIMATGENESEARNKAIKLARELESIVGKYVYGRDGETLEGVIGQLLKDNDKTIAVAESCTAGQLGSLITSAAGSSAYFLGGAITYANEIKSLMLGVSEGLIETEGAVSEACAVAMAKGCRERFRTDYALSITGIAGPDGGTPEKPVGTTYVGLASPHNTFARHFRFGADRHSNRKRATYAALELLRRELLDIK